MAMTIALATTKGGSGKSTLTVLLAGEFAKLGLSVLVLDTDPQQTVSKWLKRCAAKDAMPAGVQVVAVKSDDELVEWLGREDADITLIDVQGAANQTLPIAAANCDLVVVPCIPSAFDAAEILKMPKLLEGLAGRGRPATPYRVVLNSVDGIEAKSRVFVETLIGLSKAGVKLANTIVAKRQNYRVIAAGVGSLYMVAKKDDALGKAINNIAELATELLGVVTDGDDQSGSAPDETAPSARLAEKAV